MSKIKRKMLATFINTAPSSTAAYEKLGVDLEELNVEMNANVNKKSNILGETSIIIDKYEKQTSVEPFFADSESALWTWLKTVIDEEKTLDDLKTDVVQVDLFGTATSGAYPATKEDVYVEVVSYGGNTEGLQIPFNLHYTGTRTAGTFNPTTKTFTPTVVTP